MEWISVEDRLPEQFTEVVCYCPGINGTMPGRDWMDSDFCIGEHSGYSWKRMDNENIQVSHWMELPKPPEMKSMKMTPVYSNSSPITIAPIESIKIGIDKDYFRKRFEKILKEYGHIISDCDRDYIITDLMKCFEEGK